MKQRNTINKHPIYILNKVSQRPSVQQALDDVVTDFLFPRQRCGDTNRFTIEDIKKAVSSVNNLTGTERKSLGVLIKRFQKFHPQYMKYHGKNTKNHNVFSMQ